MKAWLLINIKRLITTKSFPSFLYNLKQSYKRSNREKWGKGDFEAEIGLIIHSRPIDLHARCLMLNGLSALLYVKQPYKNDVKGLCVWYQIHIFLLVFLLVHPYYASKCQLWDGNNHDIMPISLGALLSNIEMEISRRAATTLAYNSCDLRRYNYPVEVARSYPGKNWGD